MIFAIAALMLGIWSGLWRMGWAYPMPSGLPPVLHASWMVSGFLGTLICLERAVALNRLAGYLAPLSSALSVIAMIAPPLRPVAPLLAAIASLGLTAILFHFYRRDKQLYFAIMTIAPLFWLVGNLLWFRQTPFVLVMPWWAGFLILTIAGERLELSRLRQLTPSVKTAFLGTNFLIIGGILLSLQNLLAGMQVFATGIILLSGWLLRYDMVRLNLRQQGLPRFVAVSLLTGYIWLITAGALIFTWDGVGAGPLYGAFLHAIFLGFIFSMIFGHGPLIFPAILRVTITFHPTFYGHLILLHISLLMRIIGDLLPNPILRLWGGILNGIAIGVFFAVTISSIKFKKEI